MSDINLQHLKYFYDASCLGSIGKAALKNHVSQPAISQGIRKLEATLNCELLVHQKNRFVLTKKGQQVAEKARGILDSCTALASEVSSDISMMKGSLPLATADSIAIWLLPPVIRELQIEFPGLIPEFVIGSVKDISQAIKNGKAEFGIVVDDGFSYGLRKTQIASGEFRCIVKNGAKPVNPTMRLLVTEERPGLKDIQAVIPKKLFSSITPMRAESWELIVELTRQGVGVGFVPDFVAARALECEEFGPLSIYAEKISYQLVLLTHRKAAISSKTEIVIERIKTALINEVAL